MKPTLCKQRGRHIPSCFLKASTPRQTAGATSSYPSHIEPNRMPVFDLDSGHPLSISTICSRVAFHHLHSGSQKKKTPRQARPTPCAPPGLRREHAAAEVLGLWRHRHAQQLPEPPATKSRRIDAKQETNQPNMRHETKHP